MTTGAQQVTIRHLESPNITTFIDGKQINIKNHQAVVDRDIAKKIVSGNWGYELVGVYEDFNQYVQNIQVDVEDLGKSPNDGDFVLLTVPLALHKFYSWEKFSEAILAFENKANIRLAFFLDTRNKDEWSDLIRWSKRHFSKFHGVSIIMWDSDANMAWNRVFKITVGRQLAFNFAKHFTTATHLWFIDSDVILPPHSLSTLLSHKREHVAGLYNFKSVAGGQAVVFNKKGEKTWPPTYLGEQQTQVVANSGLVECDWTGAGCLLLSRKIFEKYSFEWSKWIQRHGEDAWICLCAQNETGQKLLVDTSVFGGHMDEEGNIW